MNPIADAAFPVVFAVVFFTVLALIGLLMRDLVVWRIERNRSSRGNVPPVPRLQFNLNPPGKPEQP